MLCSVCKSVYHKDRRSRLTGVVRRLIPSPTQTPSFRQELGFKPGHGHPVLVFLKLTRLVSTDSFARIAIDITVWYKIYWWFIPKCYTVGISHNRPISVFCILAYLEDRTIGLLGWEQTSLQRDDLLLFCPPGHKFWRHKSERGLKGERPLEAECDAPFEDRVKWKREMSEMEWKLSERERRVMATAAYMESGRTDLQED